MGKILFDKFGQFLDCCPGATLCAYVTLFHVYCHCPALVKWSETVGSCSEALKHRYNWYFSHFSFGMPLQQWCTIFSGYGPLIDLLNPLGAKHAPRPKLGECDLS